MPPSSFEDWKTLVRGFFDALIADARFGKDAILSWWFEVWNEPNIERFWLGNFGQYLDLYRATSEAVLEGGYDVRLGGPAIAYLPDRPDGPTPGEQLMKDFLTFLSENPQVKCDFLSLHRKGSFLPPDAAGSDEPGIDRPISAAEETAQLALQIDPERFRGVTVVNNEADIKVGFEVPFEPRMTEAFPAWLTGLAIAYDALSSEFAEHNIRFMAASDDANLQLVMNTFDGRRSLMTRASSSPGDLFKVPVFNFYELLKLLGDRHGTFITGGELYYPNSELFHAITASDTHVGSVFCVHPMFSGHVPHGFDLSYSIQDIPWERVNVARFQIDFDRSNSYTAAGRRMSIPFPAPELARDIRLAQELAVFSDIERGVELADGTFHDAFEIDPFTTILYWITPFVGAVPAEPAWIEAKPVDGNVVLRWTSSTEPSFYTYRLIRFGGDTQKPGEIISPEPLRAAIWIDTQPPSGEHIYGVAAVDASGNQGNLVLSDAVQV